MVIQVQHLDLEEQEQLDKIKQFWERWGNIITGVLIVGLLGFAGWRGYDWYQSQQAGKASLLYDQVRLDAQSGDAAKLAESLKTMQEQYGSTTYAQQAGLLAASTFFQKGQVDQAKAALTEVIAEKADKGLQSMARLQLAQILTQQKQYDLALQQVSGSMDPAFEGLAADAQGDIHQLQGKTPEAIQDYTRAYKALEAGLPYRQMVALKLTALGVDIAPETAAASSASEAAAASAAGPASSAASASSAAQAG